jgi:hypothetical protein
MKTRDNRHNGLQAPVDLKPKKRRDGEAHAAFEAIVGRSIDFPGDRARRRRQRRRTRVARNGEVVLWEAERDDGR